MKSTVLHSLRSAAMVGIAAGLLFSCSEGFEPESSSLEFGEYTKTLTLTDASGENSMELKVGAHDPSVLALWQAENFILTPVLEGKSLAEAVAHLNVGADGEDSGDDVEMPADDDGLHHANEIFTMELSRHMAPGVTGLAITLDDPYDGDLRDWLYGTHYSETNQQDIWLDIWGNNIWHRGYYRAFAKVNSTDAYYEIAPDKAGEDGWIQIKNGDDIYYYFHNHYVVRFQRKYKSTSNPSVTFKFTY